MSHHRWFEALCAKADEHECEVGLMVGSKDGDHRNVVAVTVFGRYQNATEIARYGSLDKAAKAVLKELRW